MQRLLKAGAMALLCAIILVGSSLRSMAAYNIMRHLSINYVDGAYPVGQYALSGGALYGFTQYGQNGYGSFIKMTTAGATTTLAEFAGGATSPYRPNAGPVLVSGNYYGTSYYGGTANRGMVFKITPAGVVTVLHSFPVGPIAGDGEYPSAGLIYSADGFLYGTTLYGGAAGDGTIFKIKPDGTGFAVIKEFDDTVDASNPYMSVCEGPDGKLWGTTYYAKNFYGGLYKINKDGTGYTFVHGFTSTDALGVRPFSDLVKAANGKLYGTCLDGGANGLGTIIAVDTATSTATTAWSFDGYTGATPAFNVASNPQCRMTLGAGNFMYGVTRAGGYLGFGTIYKLDTSTNTVVPVTSFTETTAHGYSNPVTLSGTTLLGTSYYGGASALSGSGGSPNGYGSGFSCTSTGTLKLIHTFYVREAYNPYDSPTVSIGGYLYGTAVNGGDNNWGVVYKINTTGPTYSYQVIKSFNNYTQDGVNPYGGLIKHTDNNLYGVTYSGGRYGAGTVFKVTTAGVLTVVYNFMYSQGNSAYRKLASGYGTDKSLFGISYQGGAGGYGTVWKCDTAGKAFQAIHHFTNLDGRYPGCTLAVEGDVATNKTKYLYGTTYTGGANNAGTLFRVTPTGSSFTVLHDFIAATGSYGSYYGGPILLISNVLYGTTYQGGTNGAGTVWKYDLGTNTYSVIHHMNNNNPAYEGAYPYGGLSTDGAGNLFGGCYAGGNPGYGTVWKCTTAGVFTKLHNFLGQPGADGAYPYGGVVYDSTTGLLYGTTLNGGTTNYGTIFNQTITP